MSFLVVRGLTIANRVIVSSPWVDGVTKAKFACRSRADQSSYCAGVQPIRLKTTTERSGSRSSST